LKISAKYNGYFLPTGTGLLAEYIIPTLKYYSTGRFLTAYWYIPFIMILFLLSPFHLIYIKYKKSSQLILIGIFSLISTLMHRPLFNINIFQSVLYFMPVYLIGITCSMNRIALYQKLTGKDYYLLLFAVLLSILQVWSGKNGNYHKNLFAFRGFDIMFFQKIVLCLFFMIWLNRFESYSNKIINTLASTSFTVFFLHPFFIRYIKKHMLFLKLDSWLIYFFLVLSISALCVIIALIIKKIIPKYSRLFIGY
jgi:surface polysaccharide O-acyltransferase-like enzyme